MPDISPTAYRLPPTAYRLPPTAYRLPPTAYRVMAKRLRDACGLPESEPPWKTKCGFVVRERKLKKNPATS